MIEYAYANSNFFYNNTTQILHNLPILCPLYLKKGNITGTVGTILLYLYNAAST
jgi:hypothetical protein